MNLPSTYKNLIILSLLKIVTSKLTRHILTTLTYSLKLTSPENKFFTTQTFSNDIFNEDFLRNKRL